MSNNKPDDTVVSPDVGRRSSPNSIGATVNEKRRRLAKFAVGAPVLVTLASRPVFGAPCLSNMLSGNLSDPNRGQCSTGASPGGWGQPGGKIQNYSTIEAWDAVQLSYGTYVPPLSRNSKGNNAGENQSANYKDGSTLSNIPAALNKGSLATSTPLRDILIEPQLNQLTRHLVCAYLNALLSEKLGTTFSYVLTPSQVEGLASGATPLPKGYSGLIEFLSLTWKKPPGEA